METHILRKCITYREAEELSGLSRVARGPDTNGEYTTFCPAHDDQDHPNLNVREAEDGTVLLRCFAGCSQERVLAELENRGIRRSDLFARRNGERGRVIPTNNAATAQRSTKNRSNREVNAAVTDEATPSTDAMPEGCTLEAYAEEKRLPVKFLRSLQLERSEH